MTSSSSSTPPHFFPTPALDHAFSGIMAGTLATMCMNPLDLIKVQFQVNTDNRKSGQRVATTTRGRYAALARKLSGADIAHDMFDALRVIVQRDGYAGLYRGITPNVVGNSTSWGLYFLFYTMIKERMASRQDSQGDGRKVTLSAAQHLLAASESGAITALMTNPIWVVKTRMFTTSKSGEALYVPTSYQQPQGMPSTASHAKAATLSKQAARNLSTSSMAESAAAPAAASARADYATSFASNRPPAGQEPIRGLIHGIRQIWRHEGLRGLYRGGGLALFGVSNGAVQFMTYEELKRWRTSVARAKRASGSPPSLGNASASGKDEAIKLDNSEYIVMSGVSKVVAIGLTYPYQVIRSRIQNHATAHIYPNIPTCIKLTWRHEGLRGFYKGMSANLIRIIPGTCVTFVVYENCSWALRGLAERRNTATLSSSTSSNAYTQRQD